VLLSIKQITKIENNWRKLVKNYLALSATKANQPNYFI